jgi:ABC-2 type transport system ATP-binding protein
MGGSPKMSSFQPPARSSRGAVALVIGVILLAVEVYFGVTKGFNEQELIFGAIAVILVVRGLVLFAGRGRVGGRMTRTSGSTPGAGTSSGASPTRSAVSTASEIAMASGHALSPVGPDEIAVPASAPTVAVAAQTWTAEVPETVIEAKDLHKRYDQVVAVDGVTFSVRRGEVFGLLGPNGAGKSTTLEMLEGLRDIDSGSAVVLGIDIKRNAPVVKRRIGVQLQATALPSFTTVSESIDLFRAFYDHTRATADLLEEFDLVPQAKQITTKLSGGQQQRLSIALAMVNDPDVVFLDEPTTGLDPQARISLWGYIERFRGRGKTVMLTTHYMEEAERLCDRVAVMDMGHVVALDTPDGLVAQYGPGTTIAFTSAHTDASTLRALKGVDSADVDGTAVRVLTHSPELVLAQLLHPNGSGATDITNLRVVRGTLEDVFLAITGRALRE